VGPADECHSRLGANQRPAQSRGNLATEIAVSLALFGASATSGTATWIGYPLGRRVLRALVGLGICWALAVAAVFIPLAHFVPVPGFLVLGVIIATIRLRQTGALENVRDLCPRCRLEQTFAPAGRSLGQWRVHGPSCLNQIAVSPQLPPATVPV
jgi:hypothetical protein